MQHRRYNLECLVIFRIIFLFGKLRIYIDLCMYIIIIFKRGGDLFFDRDRGGSWGASQSVAYIRGFTKGVIITKHITYVRQLYITSTQTIIVCFFSTFKRPPQQNCKNQEKHQRKI